MVAIVLKRLSDVRADSGYAYATINGAAVGSDGATQKAGYQVPSPRGQAEIIKKAWRESGLPAGEVSYVEYENPHDF